MAAPHRAGRTAARAGWRRISASFGTGGRIAPAALAVPAAVVLAACTGGPVDRPAPAADTADIGALARMVDAPTPLECVPYARDASGVALRGDAWTWWDQAEGVYARGKTPEVGAVLVLRRHGKSRGHVAVVTRVVSDRVVVAEHANWLNSGRIHKDTPIMDVSPGNDWSAVRVWYTPGGTWGRRAYPAYGFISPTRLAAS